ncbi:YlxR family protein [Ornithinimicrobium sp. LYQ92]|uniref:YlxR family protein n=1 Tax=Serinicoccus sp. LYQ92 TaxID=3378798 RepID=UPI00385234C8
MGCRSRDEQSALLRVVARPDGSTTRWRILVDERRREPGRGAYLHRDPQCLRSAITRRGLTRALRLPAGSEVELAEVEERMAQQST